jgi:hypothetical protein
MSVEVNWIAIAAATVASMIVGTVWYSKSVFGTVWMHLAGLDNPKLKPSVVGPMVTAVLGSLLTAYILAHLSYMAHAFFKQSFFMDAVTTAFWVWLGLSATTLAIHNSFEQKPVKLTMLAIGNRFVTYIAMGIVIGLLRP